jgi:hypothetical protein
MCAVVKAASIAKLVQDFRLEGFAWNIAAHDAKIRNDDCVWINCPGKLRAATSCGQSAEASRHLQ